ncbi:DUF3990 domain-containing protein [Arcanobacterium hippocoleae]|uniref:DUF3990 domain-containing protein n=1 Tax=Arcanobacterium hippocoleae TaxID=149017 RepID=A0ABU1T3G1_9ACTO|nr:DUF3990 domain-containing protein [Arcanobacterium hippocoleae]MDR6939917.1 hypothetical protein [Arcanobacterium hippocoleae]
MSELILFHGSPNKIVVPAYGKGEEKHDYGQGFYLTDSIDLAKEWAVCRPNEENGWVHKYHLDTAARQKMRELVDSDANCVTKVFSTLFTE